MKGREREVGQDWFLIIGILGVCVMLIAGWRYGNVQEFQSALMAVTPGYIFGVLGLKIIVQCMNGLRLNLILRSAGLRLRMKVWLPLSCAGTLQNVLLPGKTSVASKGFYLKQKWGLAYKQYAAATLIGMVVFLAVNIPIFLFFWIQGERMPEGVLVWVPIGILAGVLAGIGIWRNDTFPVVHRLRKLAGGLHPRDVRQAIPYLTLNEVGLIAVRAAALWVCFSAVGVDVSVWQMVEVSILASFSGVVNLTPGNLGITESVIVGLAVMQGLPLEGALSASLLSRAASLSSQLFLLLCFSRNLVK